jgi:hypothetical protein
MSHDIWYTCSFLVLEKAYGLLSILFKEEKVYITPPHIGGGLHNPQLMKRSISPLELSKTGQVTP